MRSKLINSDQEKTYAVIFDKGDEVMKGLLAFAKQEKLTAGHFTAIGAFSSAILGYFELEKKDYKRIPVDEQVEVLSLIGDVALHKGEPKLHAHVVVGMADGTAMGGHLIEARVMPTLEVILTEAPQHLRRQTDEETGLPLIVV